MHYFQRFEVVSLHINNIYIYCVLDLVGILTIRVHGFWWIFTFVELEILSGGVFFENFNMVCCLKIRSHSKSKGGWPPFNSNFYLEKGGWYEWAIFVRVWAINNDVGQIWVKSQLHFVCDYFGDQWLSLTISMMKFFIGKEVVETQKKALGPNWIC